MEIFCVHTSYLLILSFYSLFSFFAVNYLFIYYFWYRCKYENPFFGSNSDLIISQNLLSIFVNLCCFNTFLKCVVRVPACSAMAGPVLICCNYIMYDGPILAIPLSSVCLETFQSRATPLFLYFVKFHLITIIKLVYNEME